MASEHVVNDRSDGNKYAIKINDGQLYYETTSNAASSEPIVQDNTNGSDYWKIFIDNGQLGYESTVTTQDDVIDLSDETDNTIWRLGVNNGEFYYFSVSVRQLVSVKSDLGFRVIKSKIMPAVIKTINQEFGIKSDLRS